MREYIGLLLAATAPDAAADVTARPDDPATVLTRREVKILGKLDSSLSNRELADALFITEGTLKWHLKNIYSKLGVTSRIAAITTGRANGLLR